ncbi:hypothetical protein ACFSOZ_24860 [Mesorhizobium newzealandense]|uniref:Uncharacterized protein n=1 Tax=Mesorhizobium newzealandense TaxID=1300302 RepID=A0ABW4UDQ1_9HYPH
MRGSLAAMTDQGQSNPDYFGLTLSDRNKHFYRHYSERNTDRWVRFLRETAEATTTDALDAAVNQWAKTR